MNSKRKGSTRSNRQPADFKQLAGKRVPGFMAEFLDFLLHNKKWWLAPIIVSLLILGLIVMLAGTGAAPFIYTLF